MAKKKLTIDDIFDDDDFGLLDSKAKTSNVKTDEDRLVDSFEEINAFFDKNKREPNKSSMSEYGLLAKLKNFRENETQKKVLKPFDRHNLLGYVEMEKQTIDDILNDNDLGLLDADKDLDIFKFKHTPRPEDRAEADFVAQRKPIKEKEFAKYEAMFLKVHKEIKEGKRKIVTFNHESLKEKSFYINSGVLLYLELVNWDKSIQKFKSGVHNRPDGRTRIIFENGTFSNMRFQSLYKTLHADGKMITNTYDKIQEELFVNSGALTEDDDLTGYIYVLQSKSKHPQIAAIKNLYKIGFAKESVEERIKNAKNEATYLFSDVHLRLKQGIVNRNADVLENLLHRFFAKSCLDIEFENEKGQRINPREWFVIPFDVIEETIQLILNENIVNYEYDPLKKKIKLK